MRTVLRALASLRRARASALLAPLVGAALWSNALTDHVGYGASLVVALLGSVAGAVVGAGLPRALRAQRTAVSGGALAMGAVGASLACALLTLLVVLSRGVFAPVCAPGTGAVAVLLVALPGVALASLAGALLGAISTRRGVATALAALLVPAFIAWSVARFYATPTIFAYDPFFGFFPGAIYDEDVPLGATLLSYRVGTLGWIVALAALLAGGWDGAALRWNTLRRNGIALVLGALGAGAGASVYLAGPALGHRHEASHVADALGAAAWSRRCVVRYDRSIARRQALLTAADCDLRVEQTEAFFGVRAPRRITVFLFADAAQKQALMGAADTYIAKPWRHEVYLQAAPFPHPVLKHEIAHVVAGAMAPGPLRVTARGALLPVPGLIEGAAVAAAWEGEGDASPHQWSRAMLDAGIAPRVATLASLGFFASSSASAYTAAGSFCRWLHDARGAERFRRLYASGDFEGVYGRGLASLEAEWHAFLRTVPVDARAVARARARFRRASIFGRACPFDLERIGDDAARAFASGAVDDAERGYRTLAARDPSDLRARLALAVLRVRRGDVSGADLLAAEAERDAGPAAGARVRGAVADALWRWGRVDEARARYASLDGALASDDEARTLWLKRDALARGGVVAETLRDLLVGRGAADPSPVAAMARAAQDRSGDPVLRYLVARQLFLSERFEAALDALGDPAAQRDRRVAAEAARIRATALFHLGRLDESRAGFEALADDPTRPQGARDLARDWADRVRRAMR